jgi:MoaA/NifB/PqqE/SkfB family radical SAM enzyme
METKTRREPILSDVFIYPTSRCNLKCRHCYFAPVYDDSRGTPDDEVSCEQICEAIDQLLPFGLRSCKFSGGEPFLRTDLLEMCRYMDSKGLRIVIETNGTLVTKHDAEVLAQLERKVFVAVSIDGAEAQTHEALRGVPGCFRKALDGLEHLVQAGINVQVIAAAYEDNKDELPRIIELAAGKGANSFKACFVNPVPGPEHSSNRDGRNSATRPGVRRVCALRTNSLHQFRARRFAEHKSHHEFMRSQEQVQHHLYSGLSVRRDHYDMRHGPLCERFSVWEARPGRFG